MQNIPFKMPPKYLIVNLKCFQITKLQKIAKLNPIKPKTEQKKFIMGAFFLVGFFPGGIFSGTIFSGRFFPGSFFLEPLFTQKLPISKLKYKIQNKNKTWSQKYGLHHTIVIAHGTRQVFTSFWISLAFKKNENYWNKNLRNYKQITFIIKIALYKK